MEINLYMNDTFSNARGKTACIHNGEKKIHLIQNKVELFIYFFFNKKRT